MYITKTENTKMSRLPSSSRPAPSRQWILLDANKRCNPSFDFRNSKNYCSPLKECKITSSTGAGKYVIEKPIIGYFAKDENTCDQKGGIWVDGYCKYNSELYRTLDEKYCAKRSMKKSEADQMCNDDDLCRFVLSRENVQDDETAKWCFDFKIKYFDHKDMEYMSRYVCQNLTMCGGNESVSQPRCYDSEGKQKETCGWGVCRCQTGHVSPAQTMNMF